ncbi:MAG TPA: GNAT family N-acetyltransferase [Actinoplanes sp.]|jgi:N-acetylglutamate synthase-like GNAT family acetyltransferase|nr:GNAT family N-acetyltransferase [Actinoplanes sp.]
MQVDVRRAREHDQAAITAMVRQARLNPADLRWPRFVVAEHDGRIVGVAQLRLHPDGACELASLAVTPSARGQGVATKLVDALLQTQASEVYTLIDRPYVDHFRRWGFHEVDRAGLPRSVARVYRIGRAVTAVASLLTRRKIRIVPLRRTAT